MSALFILPHCCHLVFFHFAYSARARCFSHLSHSPILQFIFKLHSYCIYSDSLTPFLHIHYYLLKRSRIAVSLNRKNKHAQNRKKCPSPCLSLSSFSSEGLVLWTLWWKKPTNGLWVCCVVACLLLPFATACGVGQSLLVAVLFFSLLFCILVAFFAEASRFLLLPVFFSPRLPMFSVIDSLFLFLRRKEWWGNDEKFHHHIFHFF